MTIKLFAVTVVAALIGSMPSVSPAVSPASVNHGRQLFERNWTPRNPRLGSDGLGPLFNGQSCVACHHQGGVGGGGDARFNAKTIGIESMKITGGPVSNDVIKTMVRSFHPGFIGPNGTVNNTLALSHHGGSSLFQTSRAKLMSLVDAQFSPEGGTTEAAEVRYGYATPILFNNSIGQYQVSIRARLFQRNTTPLFGLGLIDNVPGPRLEEQVKLQKQHSEISGRLSTLGDGRYGRFGWRGNVASLLEFVDQACAAEVGLETKRKQQPTDPMIPDYRNPAKDIKDEQILAMRDFLVALPVPTREIPSDSEQRTLALRGERVFAAVGCAVCHVPNMAPAAGIYSDLLLHDMGPESMDLNHAEPFIARVTPISRITEEASSTTRTVDRNTTGYYGGSSAMTSESRQKPSGSSGSSSDSSPGSEGLSSRGSSFYEFRSPTQTSERIRIIPMGSRTWEVQEKEKVVKVRDINIEFRSGRTQTGTEVTKESTRRTMKRQDYLRLHIQPTNFNQEWQTPPLWGVADSAPYMHDGRAETLLEAIAMHDGESAGTRDRFLNLSFDDRNAVVAFLNTLVAPPNAPQTTAGSTD